MILNKELNEKISKQKIKNKEEKNITVFNMLKPEEMKQYIINASIVVTHAGVGTIMECIEHNKDIIVLPRKEENGEHVNNHQEEIAFEMEEIVIELIKNSNNKKEKKYISNNEKFNDMLIDYLESI